MHVRVRNFFIRKGLQSCESKDYGHHHLFKKLEQRGFTSLIETNRQYLLQSLCNGAFKGMLRYFQAERASAWQMNVCFTPISVQMGTSLNNVPWLEINFRTSRNIFYLGNEIQTPVFIFYRPLFCIHNDG